MVGLPSALMSLRARSMDILPLLCIVSVAFTGLTKGAGVLPDGPQIAAVGATVTFTTTLTPTEKPLTVSWRFGEKGIVTAANGVISPGPGYEDRINLITSTGSLELRSLTLNDTGAYEVIIIPQDGAFQNGDTRLEVYVPVSNVTVTPSSTDLVEFNSSVRLSCSSSGSSLSFLWLNSSSEVTASDRVQITDGNFTLTIMNVTRYDQGPFMCRAFNPFNDGTSNQVNLSISFGPENTNLILSPSQEYFVEGSDINLSCSADSRPAAMFYWFLNGEKLPDTGPGLRLMNVQKSQSGNYSCQAFNQKTERYKTSKLSSVSVLARVANVVVTSNTTDLVEFNSTVSLFCSARGYLPSFLWLNSSSEVTASDRVQITDGGSTLTIMNVTRYDQGPFMCRAFNYFSNSTSDPVNLSISYGPESVSLTICPSQQYFEEGSNISLICSADSRPSALFYWFLNGDLLSGPDTGPELRLMNIQINQSSNYSCQAFNSKTLRYETSEPSLVSVLERISGASVTPTNVAIEGNSVNLTCDAAGSVFTRKWMKDGSDLTLTDNMKLYDENRVLSFNPVNKTDKGEYSCRVSNPVSSEDAKHIMVVNYGPENVEITGPNEIDFEQTLTLTCFAKSIPSASYTWIRNGTEIHNSAVFTKHKTESSDSGNYTCQAKNNITGRASSAVHELTVTVLPDPTQGCSAGCIAGIVIACLVVCGAAAGGGGYCIYKKKKNRKPITRAGGEGQDNTAYSGNQELNYADVRIVHTKDAGAVRQPQQSDTSEYAQVRVSNNPPMTSSPPTYDAHMMQRIKRPAPQPDANGTQLYAQVRKN